MCACCLDKANATMNLDPVLAEIRQIRAAHSDRFGGDVRAILDDLRRREQQSGRKLVSRAVDPPPPEVLEYQKRKLRDSKVASAAMRG
jgi:hypothetical protein